MLEKGAHKNGKHFANDPLDACTGMKLIYFGANIDCLWTTLTQQTILVQIDESFAGLLLLDEADKRFLK